ncbi:MAG: hypothetical protein KIT83_01920 [Bryobacterales bacterium]|nr:hypothetical protein [Bryobacterales bacterium]
MSVTSHLRGSRQRLAALLMAAVLCFLAIALFSPLHQHRADGSCSLNGFEYIVQAESQAAIPALSLSTVSWCDAPELLLSRSLAAPPSSFLRGPPATA